MRFLHILTQRTPRIAAGLALVLAIALASVAAAAGGDPTVLPVDPGGARRRHRELADRSSCAPGPPGRGRVHAAGPGCTQTSYVNSSLNPRAR